MHPFDHSSNHTLRPSSARVSITPPVGGCVLALQAEIKSALDRAYDLTKAGKPILATDLILGVVDRWIWNRKFDQVSLFLQEADPFRLPPASITGLLCLTLPKNLGADAEVLGKARVDFFDLSMLALTEVSHWSEESIQALKLRLR